MFHFGIILFIPITSLINVIKLKCLYACEQVISCKGKIQEALTNFRNSQEKAYR